MVKPHLYLIGLFGLLVVALGGLFTSQAQAYAPCTGASPTWYCPTENNLLALKDLVVTGAQAGLQEGDVVNLAAGSITLVNRIKITNKSFQLIGAGIGNTIIDFQDTTAGGYCGISWTTHATGGPVATPGIARVSGFTYKSTTGCHSTGGYQGAITFIGTSANVRLDHVWCSSVPYADCLTIQNVKGVADHNIFTFPNIAADGGRHLTTTFHQNWTTANADGFGDTSWAAASSFGTVNNFYFEDDTYDNLMPNALEGIYATDDSWGSRAVYRFTQFHNNTIQTHGTETNGRPRGSRHNEDYRNYWLWDRSSGADNLGGNRGGSFKYFDNTAHITGSGVTRMFTHSTYRADATPTDGHPSYPIFGACGVKTTITSITRSGGVATVTTTSQHWVASIGGSGTYVRITGANEANFNNTFVLGQRLNGSTTQFTYPVADIPTDPTVATGTPVLTSPFDQNTDSTGTRCLDQVGAGQSALYNGFYPSVLVAGNNAYEPSYIIHNMLDGVLSSAGVGRTGAVTENRDFFNENPAFDGVMQHGVGRGVRVSRPAACTVGEGWWATDDATNWNTSTTETFSARITGLASGADGALDVCTVTGNPGTWVNASYVPYTYPHPLIAATDIFTPPAVTTFGQTAIGTLNWNSTPASILFNKFTAPNQAGTITKLSVYAKDGSGGSFATGGAIYADNAGVPGTKLAEDSGNATVSSSTFAWYDIPVSYTFSANQVLWLAFWGNSNNLYYAYENTGGTLSYNSVPTFETWPAPNTVSNPSTRLLSIYATFNGTASPQPNDMANLAVGTTATTTQVLTWDALTGGTAPRTGSIELCIGFGCTNFASYATGLTTPATLTGLTHSTLYRARGWTVDANQAISLARSNIIEFTTTTPAASTAPAKPTGVRISGASTATAVAIIWDANAEGDLAGYKVYQTTSLSNLGPSVAIITPASAAAAHSPVTRYMATAIPGATTSWVVTAYDTDGNESLGSDVVSQTLADGVVRTATTRAARQ